MFPEKPQEENIQDAPQATTDSEQTGNKTTITTSVVSVEILGFSDPIEGKIDTGAAQSSLHAEEIEVDGDRVTFVLNDRRYRTTVKTTQEVSSADGGQQSRPVITISLTIAGKNVPEVDVNLNDRSGMPQQLLIGQDVIKGADLVIDISEEPADAEEGVAAAADGSIKPEQEEVPTGVAVRPEVTSQSIAQLGDNPLAHKDETQGAEATGGEVTLLDVKTQLQDLLAKVEKLIQAQG